MTELTHIWPGGSIGSRAYNRQGILSSTFPTSSFASKVMMLGIILMTGGLCEGSAAVDVTYVSGSSQKLEQFVGNTDFQTALPTLSQTAANFGLNNTDLGVPFRHHGQTFLGFGDSNFPGTADALAYTTDTDPESGLTLTVVNTGSGFTPVSIPGISHSAFDVPIYGLSLNGFLYLYYSTDANPGIPLMGRTVLAVSTNDGVTFSAPLYTLSSNLFINVSVIRVNCADWSGLPQTSGLALLIFGSGPYRKSDIYLAFQPETGISNAATIRYFQGLDSNNAPAWGAAESNSVRIAAVAFTNASQVVEGAGELSATFNVFLKKWMLFYNLSGQIQFRTADQPWGPYTAHKVSFDPTTDGGYGNFIYKPGLDDTNLCNPNVTGHDTSTTGGVYGPYIFSEFTQGSADANSIQTTMYHSMSTWNPYNSVLMRAQFIRRVPPVIFAGTRVTNSVTTAAPGGADAHVQSGTSADLNFGSSQTIGIKNAGITPGNVSRKGYLRFPLNLPSSQRIANAALTLTVGNTPPATGRLTYDVYGLRSASPGQNWSETNITWNTAPANLTNDSEGIDPAQAVFLGSFTTDTNRAFGTQSTFSSMMLNNFLNQSSNGPVTLILSRLTIDSAVESFASKESTNPPPMLTYVTMPRLPDAVIGRNSISWPVGFNVDSTVVAPGTLTVTASCSDTNLVPSSGIVLSGSGSNRLAAITPSTNHTGSAVVSLAVSDGVATTDSISFQLTVASNAPPRLAIQNSPGNPVSFSITGNPGATYAVQASSNLTSWTTLWVTNPPGSTFYFTDNVVPPFPARYYRVAVGE